MLHSLDLTQKIPEKEYTTELPLLQAQLRELAYQLYLQRRLLIVVYEGWDAAGKGGNIRRVTAKLDPRGYEVFAIAAPSGEDKTHHYLYRFWRRLRPPEEKQVLIFDRSWYGRVLVERIEGFAKEHEWKRAYREINNFERQLTDTGAIVVKFWLHISPEEQLKRFKEREEKPYKSWKLTNEDWRNRDRWPEYLEAAEEMILKTSTIRAPWTIVEGNYKWWARIKCLRELVGRLSRNWVTNRSASPAAPSIEPPPMPRPLLVIDSGRCRDFSVSSRLEWLETNGAGGFAMSTVSGCNTRRYHAILLASLQPPVQRRVLLSRVEETAAVPGFPPVPFGAAQYPGALTPAGFSHLACFQLNPFPQWRYQLPDGGYLEKTLFLPYRRQTAVLLYRTNSPVCRLTLRVFLANRDYHHLQKAYHPFNPGPLHLHHNAQAAVSDPHWYFHHEYVEEAARGLDSHEDLYTPGVYEYVLTPECPAFLAAGLDPAAPGLSGVLSWESAEAERRWTLASRSRLHLAADAFLAYRADGSPTLMAGYPWFTDWGRDTMIAAPGLLLSRGLDAIAARILDGFLSHLHQGLIPNRFPDSGESPEYNTADATLWTFPLAWELHRRGREAAFLRGRFYPAALEILQWHRRGTLYGIGADPADGLLHAGDPTTQLTWMDARVEGRPVTPRHGKPVEINALWYNALRITAALAAEFASPAAAGQLDREADLVRNRFEATFWNPSTGCLHDTADPFDPAIRPNQIFALSLPFPMLALTRATAVLDAVERRLLAPGGLRTLDPAHPAYQSHYRGGPRERDAAYHQGTVWPWLLAPYVKARLQVFGRTAANLSHCRQVGESLLAELDRGCLNSLPEIQGPGAPAQAWSVAAALEILEILDPTVGPSP